MISAHVVKDLYVIICTFSCSLLSAVVQVGLRRRDLFVFPHHLASGLPPDGGGLIGYL